MIDQKREAEVWKRVMDLSAQAPENCKPKEKSVLTAQQVMELLEKELEDESMYEALAGRVRQPMRQTLLGLAKQERQHALCLETVYYLITGKKPCFERSKRPCIASTTEELRSRYHAELAGAEVYCTLRQKAGAYADTFHKLSEEERYHAAVVMQILQTCL